MNSSQNFAVKTKIGGEGSRNHRLSIPGEIMAGMGWSHDEVEIYPDPDNGRIIITNPKRPAVGFMGFHFNLQEMKWAKNKKKYQRELAANLSPLGRKVLNNTNWDEVEDGGYWNVKNYHYYLQELSKKPRKNKEQMKSLLEEAENLIRYLEKHGGKNPVWMKPIERDLSILRKKLFKQQKIDS